MIHVLNSEDLELEIQCPKCYGTGTLKGDPCPLCDGTREIITDFGTSILAFIKKHMERA